MSLADSDIPSTAVFDDISKALSNLNDEERKKQLAATNATFELRIKNKAGKEGIYTVDMKKEGSVKKGAAKPKADAVISMSDETFAGLVDGSGSAQKAFMTGGLKVRGNIVVATKLDSVLKQAKSKL